MVRARATDSDSLVKAAAQVFRDKGYRNSTIDDIAETAGVARATVYTYAKNKRWLLDRIVLELLDELRQRMNTDLNSGLSPRERLRAVITTAVELGAVNRTFFAVLLSEETELSAAVRRRFRTWAHQTTNDFRALLDDCVSPRSVKTGLDTTVAANLVISMLVAISRWYDPRGPLDTEQLIDQVLMVIAGILGDD